jgi:SAM-dependent methyltransferase
MCAATGPSATPRLWATKSQERQSAPATPLSISLILTCNGFGEIMGVASNLSGGLRLVGIDFGRLCRTLMGLPRYWGDVARYRSCASQRFPVRLRYLKPMLLDYASQAGVADGHYFFQDLWAARKIFAIRPEQHFDIGSRVDGFVAHVLSFMPVSVMDIRPLTSDVPGLTFVQADATNLEGISDDSVESLSSLHATEHFGLGRYADVIDPEACFKAMAAMQRVLRPGGRLYFSVPVGFERLEFNAQRVFDPRTILATFHGLQLVGFAAVDDAGVFHPQADPADFTRARYACGMFELTKPPLVAPEAA